MPDGARLTIADLIQRTGINPVTLRSWVRHAVVPRGIGRARGTHYTEDHVLRILAVQSLRASGLGLMQVAHRIRRMTPEELAQYAPGAAARVAPPADVASAPVAVALAPVSLTPPSAPTNADAPPSAVPYRARTLEWIELMPGLTLLVDPSGGEVLRRSAREIVARYALNTDARTPRG